MSTTRRSPRRCLCATLMLAIPLLTAPSAFAADVAVIGNTGIALDWCTLLETYDHSCVNLPTDDPGIPLNGFDIVIHMGTWTDPNGELADFMQSGKGVITRGSIPNKLGIDSDPVVQAWIGANAYLGDGDDLLTIVMDPILGFLQPGTLLAICSDSICAGLDDTTGHPDAKVLARLGDGTGSIGIMRNSWESGQSVYFMDHIGPHSSLYHAIILNAVRELSPPPPIPTVSAWGVAAMTLLLLAAGSVIVRRKLSVVSCQ